MYELVRFAIMNGDLSPGALVRPVELAESMGGRTALARQALERLAGEGLVEIATNDLFRIAPLDRARALETIDVFQAILMAAARWSIPNLTNEDLLQLRAVSVAYVSALEESDLSRAIRQFDRLLHLLRSAARNRELDLVVEPIETRFLRVLRLYLPQHDASVMDLVKEHLINLSDIEKRDAMRVMTHISRRLDYFRQVVVMGPNKPWEAASHNDTK